MSEWASKEACRYSAVSVLSDHTTPIPSVHNRGPSTSASWTLLGDFWTSSMAWKLKGSCLVPQL